MELEKAIKQSKPFESPFQKVAVNLIYTNSWLETRMKTFFTQFGLTSKQYNIMRILNGAGKPVSVAFIRNRLIEKLSDVSRLIDRMDTKGFVKKETSQVDKRLVDIVLTNKGLQLLAQVNSRIKILDNVFSNLNLEEINRLNELLDKLRINKY